MVESYQLKKGCAKQNHPSRFDSAESFDPKLFDLEFTTEGLVVGRDSLILNSIKRSLRLVGVVAPTPRRAPSIFDVRCWTLDVRRSIGSLFRPDGFSNEVLYKAPDVG
jgi:hypothetical protein